MKRKLKRRFLGEFPPKSNFEKKHLEAYLKGQTHFNYKRRADGSPHSFEVKQEYYEEEIVKDEPEVKD